MKEINFSKELELKGYYERLENGLEVYLVPMEKKDKYFITYATKFGSIATQFTPYKEKSERTVPNGVAHFLEHKMFEQEDGIDPFTFFSESGTDANASTNFDLTRYICYGTKNFDKNLRYLIKYVNSPYFTDENVEKEKGIIAQEINMYKDEAGYAIEDIDENTSFFTLGVTSIQALKVLNKMRKTLDIEINPAVIFEYKCIADLAKYLESCL